MDIIKYILENDLGTLETNYYFKDITTIGTGGLIKYFYTPNNENSLCKMFKFVNDNNIKYFIIGNGSNVLASDDFFDGIVINMKKMPIYLNVFEDYIEVSSSYPTTKLAYDLAKLELGDLSFLYGIPGLIGGAIYNNSGAYNKEIKDYVLEVKCINKNGEIIAIENRNLGFDYRSSIFHFYNCIIISVKLKIERVVTIDKLDNILRKRKDTQPLEYKNMGSIFKNNLLVDSWKVIDLLNLRGFTFNGTKISEKHTNFIINYNNSTTNDILSLIEYIKKRAFLELGITLETELTII